MNERIAQLAQQAANEYLSEMEPVTDTLSTAKRDELAQKAKQAGIGIIPHGFSEKFAELIVRECINEIAYIGKANEVFGDRTDRGGLNHILWTTETAIEKIKQHFGVEE